MKVHQLVATAAPHDAVTGHAARWAAALRGFGLDGGVCAEHVAPGAEALATRLRPSSLAPEDAVVLHYSISSSVVVTALEHAGPRLGYYHNVTPGHLLRDYNPSIADLCDQARDGLRELSRLDAIATTSQFSATDLVAAGLKRPTVVPLGFEPVRATAPRPPSHGPRILSVGRIAPNKRIEDVVRAFALFQRYRAPHASLELVGSPQGFDSYHRALRELIRELGVSRVRMHGAVDDKVRDDLYRTADGYLCMSIHEGFCAPLVEALGHGVPVVARAAGAVPETLDDAGIVIDGGDLAVFAEALAAVTRSAELRAQLRAAGARRVARLQGEVVDKQIQDFVRPVVSG